MRAGVGLVLVIFAAASAAAKITPAELTPTFTDRAYPARSASASSPSPMPACIVNFIEIVDQRRSPELAGVIGKRAINAPKDVGVWLRAVLGGLVPRGVQPTFGGAASTASIHNARFTLQTAWIQEQPTTYSANVVVQVALDDAAPKSYRGRVSRTAYWSGGVDTMQSAIDGAFANALDAIAADLRPLCSQ